LKKITLLALGVFTILVMSACGETNDAGNTESDGDVYTLKIASSLSEGDPIYDGMVDLSESVEEKTDGGLIIEVYGNDALGELNDIIEQAKEGANVAALVDSGRLADYIPEMGVLTAPYIVEDYDAALKVTDSDLFEGWNSQLREQEGLDILAFNWYQGDRHFITKNPVENPEDLKGLKIRTIDSAVASKTMNSLGVSPTGEAFSEVYSAIQQGVIDGAEAQFPALWDQKLYEVAPNIAKTGHFQLLTGIIAGETFIDNIPEEYNDILHEEAFNLGEEASRNTIDSLDTYENDMKENGVEITEVDTELFKEKTDEIYTEIDGYEELKNEIEDILGE